MLIILDSARKHGISDEVMVDIISDPYEAYRLRSEPLKILHIGFDSKARAIEVITDTGDNGDIFIIHADKLTKKNEKLLGRYKDGL